MGTAFCRNCDQAGEAGLTGPDRPFLSGNQGCEPGIHVFNKPHAKGHSFGIPHCPADGRPDARGFSRWKMNAAERFSVPLEEFPRLMPIKPEFGMPKLVILETSYAIPDENHDNTVGEKSIISTP